MNKKQREIIKLKTEDYHNKAVMLQQKRKPKIDRERVYNKYNGHCAYCGKEIEYKDMQVDHLISKYHNGDDEYNNLMPSCRSCNHYKRANSLEGFRRMLMTIQKRLFKIYIFKVAVDYKVIDIKLFDGKFYFEK